MSVEIDPLSGAIGSEFIGVVLSGSLDNTTFVAIHDTFVERLVLVSRSRPKDDLGLRGSIGGRMGRFEWWNSVKHGGERPSPVAPRHLHGTRLTRDRPRGESTA